MIPLSIFNIDISSGNLILLVSLLMIVAILMTKVGTKFGVPTMLLFLIIGMVAGEDGIGVNIQQSPYVGILERFGLQELHIRHKPLQTIF